MSKGPVCISVRWEGKVKGTDPCGLPTRISFYRSMRKLEVLFPLAVLAFGGVVLALVLVQPDWAVDEGSALGEADAIERQWRSWTEQRDSTLQQRADRSIVDTLFGDGPSGSSSAGGGDGNEAVSGSNEAAGSQDRSGSEHTAGSDGAPGSERVFGGADRTVRSAAAGEGEASSTGTIGTEPEQATRAADAAPPSQEETIPRGRASSADPNPATRDAAAASAEARLELDVRPWGNVFVDDSLHRDEAEGTYTLTLSPGSHDVRITHPSLGTQRRVLTLEPGGVQRVSFDLNERYPVTVTSSPTYGEIYVDGRSTGRYTPHRLQLPAGVHRISVDRSGFRSTAREIELEEGRADPLHFDLQAP